RDFVLELLALALLGDQFGNGTCRLVERVSERANLIALVNADAIAEIAAPHVEGGFIEIVDGVRDGPRQDDARRQRGNFKNKEDDSREDEKVDEQRSHGAHGPEELAVHRHRAQRKRSEDGGWRRVHTRLSTLGFERGSAVHADIEPMRRGFQLAIADDLFAGHVQSAVFELDRQPGRGSLRGRLKENQLNGPEPFAQVVEKPRRERLACEDDDCVAAGRPALCRCEPKLAFEFHKSRKVTASVADQMPATVHEDMQIQSRGASRRNQICYSRAREHGIIGSATLGSRQFNRIGYGVGVGGNGADAIAQMIAQKVGAELEMQQVRGHARHRQKKHYWNDRDEDIRNHQAAAESPQELRAHPRQQTYGEIKHRNESEETQEGRKRNRASECTGHAENDVENHDRERDAIQRRKPPQNHSKTSRRNPVHGRCTAASLEHTCSFGSPPSYDNPAEP